MGGRVNPVSDLIHEWTQTGLQFALKVFLRAQISWRTQTHAAYEYGILEKHGLECRLELKLLSHFMFSHRSWLVTYASVYFLVGTILDVLFMCPGTLHLPVTGCH